MVKKISKVICVLIIMFSSVNCSSTWQEEIELHQVVSDKILSFETPTAIIFLSYYDIEDVLARKTEEYYNPQYNLALRRYIDQLDSMGVKNTTIKSDSFFSYKRDTFKLSNTRN